MKFLKKWSYMIMLLLCGVVVIAGTDSLQAVGEPAGKIKQGILALEARITGRGSLPVGSDLVLNNSSGEGKPDEDFIGENTGEKQEEDKVFNGVETESGEPGGEDVQENSPQSETIPEVTYTDPSEVVYQTVEDDYFSDAVFIGDSRTVGMFEYGDLENISTFYASTGMTIYSLLDANIVEVAGQKQKITIEQALGERQFAKIYLMVGINEMGRGDLEGFLEAYAGVVERLKQLQPEAVIYLQSIIRVSEVRSKKGDYIHNEGIHARNEGIAALADNVRVYYLDVNPVLCDINGNLEASYTADGVHLKAKYIPLWKDFLKQHAVVLD